jgi:GntR family transcriptional regulator
MSSHSATTAGDTGQGKAPTPLNVAVDEFSTVPLYDQIKQVLVDRIQRGELRIGDRLSAETELEGVFNVSRITVRRAIQELVREGFLYRKPGKGTFVVGDVGRRELQRLRGFQDDMTGRGHTVSSQVLSVNPRTHDAEVASRLKLEDREPIFRLARLRLADGVPMAVQTSWLPAYLCPGLETMDLTGSLYSLLEQHFNLRLYRGDHTIRARRARSEEAQLLGITRGAPVLTGERQVYLADLTPLEFVTSVSRGDLYYMKVTLFR